MKRYPIFLIDRSVNAGIVGFRGSTQPTGGNPTENKLPELNPLGNSPKYTRWNDGGMEVISVEQLENRLNADPSNLARGIHYDFLSTLNATVKNSLKTTPVNIPNGSNPSTAFLSAEPDYSIFSSNSSILNTAIWHDSSTENRIFNNFLNELDLGTSQVGIGQIHTPHSSTLETSTSQISTSQISTIEVGMSKIGTSQIGTSQIGVSETSLPQLSTSEISSTQVTSLHKDLADGRFTQIDSNQIGSIQLIRSIDSNFGKISLPSSITLQQLLNIDTSEKSHNPNLQNTTVSTWTEFLQSPTPFNLKIEITDLPTGQLASATITGYDTNNRPNSGTLTLDTDGNSLGWFIDTTPDDNTEFDQTLSNTAYRATTGAASGKYDLLTTILHELGHLNGIIRGNTAFDTHVQNINGIPTFINGGITAQLTPDGSHLNSTLYPYDLMNTSLKPGVRKLPSTLDLSILNAINSGVANGVSSVGTVNPANLTAGALIGITNGDFTTPTTWNTAGATNIINGSATLTEQSQKLSELTQAFIRPPAKVS